MRNVLLSSVMAVAVAGLSSCTSSQTEQIDTQLANTVPRICNVTTTLYTAFTIVAATGKIKQKAVDKVDAAYAAVAEVCANPDNVKASTIPLVVARAYADFIKATTEARR